jgi:hypothetical protein
MESTRYAFLHTYLLHKQQQQQQQQKVPLTMIGAQVGVPVYLSSTLAPDCQPSLQKTDTELCVMTLQLRPLRQLYAC